MSGSSGTDAYPGYTVNAVMLGLGVEIFAGVTSEAHARVRMPTRGRGYQLSQRCRTLIEELFGEAKDWHGLRRFRRRGRVRVQQEAYLVGWVLNLKRLAKSLPVPVDMTRVL